MANQDFESPGVFTKETPPQPSQEGLSISKFGLVGRTRKGPTNELVEISSWSQFKDQFGGLAEGYPLPLHLQRFFIEGGSQASIVRIAPEDAEKAEFFLDGTDLSDSDFLFRAISKGEWGNDVGIEIEGDQNTIDDSGSLPEYKKFDVKVSELSEGLRLVSEIFESVNMTDATADDYIVDVINDSEIGSEIIDLLEGDTGPGVPDSLEASDETETGVVPSGTKQVDFTLTNTPVHNGSLEITTTSLTVTDDGLGNLEGDVDPDGINKINYETGRVRVTFSSELTEDADAAYVRFPQTTGVNSLSGGSDGSGAITQGQVTADHLESDQEGIFALDKDEDPLIVWLPDFAANEALAEDLKDYVSVRKGRFSVITTPQNLSAEGAVRYRANDLTFAESDMALYWPWIRVEDPFSDLTRAIPPVGDVVGIYARVEEQEHPGFNPAGTPETQLRQIVGLNQEVSEDNLDTLFGRGVNPIIDSENRGQVIWASRTLNPSEERNKFVGARRQKIFVRHRIWQDLQFAVHRDNRPELWGRIEHRVGSFLRSLWQDGEIRGATEDEAFTVIADERNNSTESNKVNVRVIYKQFKPAEFIEVEITREIGSQQA